MIKCNVSWVNPYFLVGSQMFNASKLRTVSIITLFRIVNEEELTYGSVFL